MVGTEDGGMGINTFNRDMGDFDLAMKYLLRITKADSDEVVEVSAEEFEEEVRELRGKISGESKIDEYVTSRRCWQKPSEAHEDLTAVARRRSGDHAPAVEDDMGSDIELLEFLETT